MQASLFITCYNDTLFPETSRAVVKLLERLGVNVEFRPEQTCCGQMHANTGFRPEASWQAREFVRIYDNAKAVVIPSSSCVAIIREQYPALLQEHGDEKLYERFLSLVPRVYEFSEFLVDKLCAEDVGAYFPHRVTYHASCHGLRALCLQDRPIKLLSKVRGLELAPLTNLDRCCGFGGTFSIKNAEVSSAMLNTNCKMCSPQERSSAQDWTIVASCTWAERCIDNSGQCGPSIWRKSSRVRKHRRRSSSRERGETGS